MGLTILLIGTRKGLMIARSTDDRRTWATDDFQFLNQEVYGVAIDTRQDPPRIFAGVGTGHWGPLLTYSDDLGRSWTEPAEPPIGFPEGSDAAVARVWQIQPAPADQPGVVYAGVEPHALFRSDDRGESFTLVEGLWRHPHRPSWMPGGGGACLHTVLPHPTDPDDVIVVMSAAGVYRTRDGGASWAPANRGIQSAFMPEDQRFPEFGQCVHKVAFHPDRPERLFAQNHFGVYRSEDRGTSWTAIEFRAAEQLRIRPRRAPAPTGNPLLVSSPGRRRAVPPGGEAEGVPNRKRGRQLGAAVGRPAQGPLLWRRPS